MSKPTMLLLYLFLFASLLMCHCFMSRTSTLSTLYAHKPIANRDISMNMFDRFVRVVSSNVNNALKNMEDPEKVLDQAVNDMQSDLVKIRQSYAEVFAAQKRMDTQKKQAETVAEDWYKRAQLALQKGDEELAREALSRRQLQVDVATDLGKQMTIQSAAIEKLYASMSTLDSKISEAKRQKDAFIARARTAKTAVKVNDLLNNLDGKSSSVEAFERMKAKVESLEAEAEVASELALSSGGSSVDLESRFKALEGNSKVDDELDLLRRQLPGSLNASPTSELPSVTSAPMSELDIEYERLKKELGR